MKLSDLLDNHRKKNLTFFSHAKVDVVGSFEACQQQVTQALEKQQVEQAMSLAAQAAVLYGAAGLMLHHIASMAELNIELEDPFGADSQAIEILERLILCQHVSETDDTEAESLMRHFPDLNIKDIEFWQQQQQRVIQLAELDDTMVEHAQRNASLLIQSYQAKPAPV